MAEESKCQHLHRVASGILLAPQEVVADVSFGDDENPSVKVRRLDVRRQRSNAGITMDVVGAPDAPRLRGERR